MFDSTVTLAGNLTRDPSVKVTDRGMTIVKLTVAVEKRRRVDGEWQSETAFVDVTVFDKLGEHLADTAGKGDRVLVVGQVEQDNWETEDGQKRSKLRVVAQDVGVSCRWGAWTGGRSAGRPMSARPADVRPGEEPF